MRSGRPVWVLLLACTLLVPGPGLRAADDPPVIDLDEWHELITTPEPDPTEAGQRRWMLGLYPGVSGVIGLPNLASYQGNIFLSLSRASSFSVYLGYGVERGFQADADIYTVGWGGVRRIPVASEQMGFYGKFLRYRRWDDKDHGLHDGLSVGTETGVGYLSLTLELGAARSHRNHWLVVAQIGIKVALPIGIPMGKIQ